MTTLKLCNWNIRGVMANTWYLCHILSMYKIDICVLTEHWLFDETLDYLNSIDLKYTSVAVADSTLNPLDPYRRGKGGVGILWNKSLNVKPIIIPEEDRIIGISVKQSNSHILYVFGIYMPSSNYPYSSFTEYVDKLYVLYQEYKLLRNVIIIGDLNCEMTGSKYMANSNIRSNVFNKFLTDTGLYSIVCDKLCKGPHYTFDPFHTGVNATLIDHIILDRNEKELVLKCEILDDHQYNVSDHLPCLKINIWQC